MMTTTSTNTATNNAIIVDAPTSAIESAASCTAPPAPKRKRKPASTTAETKVEMQELKRVKRKLVKDFRCREEEDLKDIRRGEAFARERTRRPAEEPDN